jgi:eukaryotic-like serine/threonine-protein kinase
VAQEASSESAVGTLLNGTYRLERVIAEGGMGVVYEAAHVRLPRRFAVKLLAKPADQSTAQTTLARFKREAEIASTLAHPHIVEVFDFQVAEEGAPYLVMELLEGEDLADRLKKGRIGAQAALRIIQEIAEALDVAHTAGVVHRDLKPANIFLSKRAGRDDFVKVLDFGVSKLIDSATLTQEKAMVGTPLYMSPEQAVGTQELTPESDIFSLGAISFEMLTGRRAFAASSIPSILYQIVHGATPKLAGRAPGLSSAVDEVFARVLSKKKADRYKRASHFSSDLGLALSRTSQIDALAQLKFDPDALPELDASVLEPAAPQTGIATGADDTEVESSTKDQAMTGGGVAHSTTPGKRPLTPKPKSHKSDVTDYSRQLRRSSRRGWLLVVVALAAIGGVVGIALKMSQPQPPVVVSAPKPSAPAPIVTPLPTTPTTTQPAPASDEETAKAGEPQFEPDPVAKHDDVQFVFHVMPRGAEINVDERKVDSGKLTLPWSKHEHHVTVRAAGYHPLTFGAPSTSNRTFELRLDRIVAPVRKSTEKKKPAHDAAPVQDL